MAVISPPAYVQAGSYDAHTDRLTITSPWSNQGVVYGLDVTQRATPSMAVNVSSGMALVANTFSTFDGFYTVANDGSVEKTVSAADSTYARIDLVVARVYDAQYAGTSNSCDIEIIPGNPSLSPTPPARPSNSVEIGRITVPAGATSVVTANISSASRVSAKIRSTALSASNQITAVSTTTDRGLVISQAALQGNTPSSTNPFFFFRNSAGAGKQLEYTTDGTNFLTIQGDNLPDPLEVNGASTNVIGSTSWSDMPDNPVSGTVTLARAAWVLINFSVNVNKTTTSSDLRVGIACTGATTKDADENIRKNLWVDGPIQRTIYANSFVMKFNAGTTTVKMQAMVVSGGGTVGATYAYIGATPLRWA